MIKYFCDACGADISDKETATPHKMRTYKTHFCNRQCCINYQVRTGHFKNMSLAGRDGRSRAMPISNREKPRRKRKII